MSTRPLSPEATERLELLARLGDTDADALLKGSWTASPRPPEVGADDRGKLLPVMLAVIARDIDDPQMPEEVHDFLCAGDPTRRPDLRAASTASNGPRTSSTTTAS